MSSASLVFLIGLAVISVALPEKKLMAKGCDRPSAFTYREDVENYIKCIKALSDHRYGKRSQPPSSLLLKKLMLAPYDFDYNSEINTNLADFYDFLKNERN